jgi:hypothetical protein
MTRSMIRPVVSQSIRTRRRRAVLSMVVASHPTRSSKSRVKREPARANGTPWVRTPWVGQARRARAARICRRHRPRSRCRHVEATVRRSYRALVVNPHKGHASLRLRSRTVTTTCARPKPTSVTDTPRRSMRRLNAVVARTGLVLSVSVCVVTSESREATRACHLPSGPGGEVPSSIIAASVTAPEESTWSARSAASTNDVDADQR